MIPSPHALADGQEDLMALPPYNTPKRPSVTLDGLKQELVRQEISGNGHISQDETLSSLQDRLNKGEISDETYTSAQEAILDK